jgi:integrase
MPYADIPEFMPDLRDREGAAAEALELTTLCAVRTTEMLGAKIDEFDMKANIWTIPGERMKAGIPHRVPLSDRAAVIVRRWLNNHNGSGYLFPGEKKGRPLSNMAMTMVLRRMEITNASVHGMRSTFRDWTGDMTMFPRDLAEQALAHKLEDETEAAYRRSDALEKRRALMQAWADYCNGVTADNVIPMHREAGRAS